MRWRSAGAGYAHTVGFEQASTRPGWLTPVAATALAVLMVLAIVLHARRANEGRSIVIDVILSAIATLIAYGRFVVAPI